MGWGGLGCYNNIIGMVRSSNGLGCQLAGWVVIDQPLRPASGPFRMWPSRVANMISQKEQGNRLVYQSNKEVVRKCSIDTTGSSEPNQVNWDLTNPSSYLLFQSQVRNNIFSHAGMYGCIPCSTISECVRLSFTIWQPHLLFAGIFPSLSCLPRRLY